MDGDKQSNEVQEVEKQFLLFKKFMDNLTEQSNLLDKEKLLLSDRLCKLNSNTNKLQIQKTQLDELKSKLEVDVQTLSKKIKQYECLKSSLESLTQTKHRLENHSLTEGLELEENILSQEIDKVWRFFNKNKSKFDDEIKDLELTLANQQENTSKMYKTECVWYKKAIEKLTKENSVLSKKLSLINEIREESNK